MLTSFPAVIPVYLKALNKRRWLYVFDKRSAPAILVDDNGQE